MFINNIPVSNADSQKYLGLHLDSKLSFDIHIKTILSKLKKSCKLIVKTSIISSAIFNFHLQSLQKTSLRFCVDQFFRDNTLTDSANAFLLNTIIECKISTKRFDDHLIL